MNKFLIITMLCGVCTPPAYPMKKSLSDLTLDEQVVRQKKVDNISQFVWSEGGIVMSDGGSVEQIPTKPNHKTVDLKASLIDYQTGIKDIFDLQEKQIVSLTNEVNELKAEIQQKEILWSSMESNLQSSTIEANNYKQELDTLKLRNAELEKEVLGLRTELVTTKDLLANKNLSLEEAMLRNQQLEQKVSDQQTAMAQISTILESLK